MNIDTKQERILLAIYELSEDVKGLKKKLFSDSLELNYRQRILYLMEYKKFYDRNNILKVKTLLSRYFQLGLKKEFLLELNNLANELYVILRDKFFDTQNVLLYSSIGHGGNALEEYCKAEFGESIFNIRESIKSLKTENYLDSCEPELNHLYNLMRQQDDFKKENSWMCDYNPYVFFNTLFSEILEFVSNYDESTVEEEGCIIEDTDIFNIKQISEIRELCDDVIFNKSNFNVYYNSFNLKDTGSQKLEPTQKLRFYSLIYLLQEIIVKDKEWEKSILTKFEIGYDSYQKSKNKHVDLDMFIDKQKTLEDKIKYIIDSKSNPPKSN